MTTTTKTDTKVIPAEHKTTRYLKMYGVKANGHWANRNQGSDVVRFVSAAGSTGVRKLADGTVKLTTAKDVYILIPHKTLKDLWVAQCDNVEVHFSKKKIVAKLTYWA